MIEAEVRHGRVRDQPLDVALADREQRPVDDADHRSTRITGVAHLDAAGNNWRHQRSHREGADLVDDRGDQDGHRRRRLAHRVGQPGVQRPQRGLHREGEEEAEEQPPLGGGGQVQLARGARGQDLWSEKVPVPTGRRWPRTAR